VLGRPRRRTGLSYEFANEWTGYLEERVGPGIGAFRHSPCTGICARKLSAIVDMNEFVEERVGGEPVVRMLLVRQLPDQTRPYHHHAPQVVRSHDGAGHRGARAIFVLRCLGPLRRSAPFDLGQGRMVVCGNDDLLEPAQIQDP